MIKPIHYKILFWFCASAAVVLSLMPTTGAQLFQLQDKVAHAALYAVLYSLR